MQKTQGLSDVPSYLFGIVLGLAGLGNSWRVTHEVWGSPALIGEGVYLVAGTIWCGLMLLFAGKWLFRRKAAKAESRDAVQSTYIALIGIATNLVSIGLLRYSRLCAMMLFFPASIMSIVYGVLFTSFAWSSKRNPFHITGSLYLPTVAGSFVTGTAAAALGYKSFAQLALGAGIFSWFSIESVILHRLYTSDEIPAVQRPALGIQFAPAAVAAVTYLTITGGIPDLFSRALLGYAILQALVLMRSWRWIVAHPIGISYWAFTFGAASLSSASLRMVEHGEQGVVRVLAPLLFVSANALILFLSVVTVRQALRIHHVVNHS